MSMSPSVRYDQATPGLEWVKVMVEIEQPPPVKLTQVHRGERYRRLRENANQQRRQLEQWIEFTGLRNAVKSMGEATAFNLLFVECTPEAAAALAKAPGVVAVMLVEDSSIDLLACTCG
jgi:hypothetical protein